MGFCSFRIDAPNWASVVYILFVFHSDFCLALVTVESSKQKRTEKSEGRWKNYEKVKTDGGQHTQQQQQRQTPTSETTQRGTDVDVVGWTPIVTATSSNKRTTQKRKKTTKQHITLYRHRKYVYAPLCTHTHRVYIYSYGGSISSSIESWCCCCVFDQWWISEGWWEYHTSPCSDAFLTLCLCDGLAFPSCPVRISLFFFFFSFLVRSCLPRGGEWLFFVNLFISNEKWYVHNALRLMTMLYSPRDEMRQKKRKSRMLLYRMCW